MLLLKARDNSFSPVSSYESLSLRGDRLFSLGFIIPAIAGAAYNHCVTHILTHVILHTT